MASALRDTLAFLNDMRAAGVIGEFAICGAVAAFRYIEPAVTEDLDISVYLPRGSGLIVDLGPIIRYAEAQSRPIEWRKEGLLIGAWPVQFLAAQDPLDQAALAAAEKISFDGVQTRVWQIEHLMAKCLQVGRPKDHLRLEQFLDRSFDQKLFCATLREFTLLPHWLDYCRRFDREDFCDPHSRTGL